MVALLLTGWRKTARAEPPTPRGTTRRTVQGVAVEHFDAPVYRRPGPLRRLAALAASGGIGVLTGVLGAILIAFSIAFAVVKLTSLLQR